jgi:hypothetical protein
MFAAVRAVVPLESVSHDFATAMITLRSQGVDRALKRVERMLIAADGHGKRLFVVVMTDFADSH